MPRKPRIYLPGVPSHIVQRGNDRSACFFEEENYLFFLECLEEASERYDVAIHAYVLMSNHIHMLMTSQTVFGISRVMQLLGNRYVQYINKKYRKTGTLWEGRHKASLVDAEQYLLTCYRYIEMNSVRANMVNHPSDYRWSSYHCHATGSSSSIVKDHEVFLRIGPTPDERMHHYRALFRAGLDASDVSEVRKAVAFSAPLGNKQFKEQIEATLGKSVGHIGRGRPKVRPVK